MGILKVGKKVILLKGRNFGKKVEIKNIEKNNITCEIDGKSKKVNVVDVFPIE